MQDTIERSIDITAPLERVWNLVTEPGWWVPSEAPGTADSTTATVERTPGAIVVRESEKYGRFPVEVVDLRPMTYAAFRWSSAFPGADLTPGQTTLIEFTVSPTDTGVRVTVVESGFAALSTTAEIRANSFASNNDGWAQQIGVLRTLAEA